MTHQPKRVVALLLLFIFAAVHMFTPLANTHMICGGCPWEGQSGTCQYCNTNHPEGSHGTLHPCGVHLTSVPGDHTLQASCTVTNNQGRTCTVTSFYACDNHSHSFPTTQEECDRAKKTCENARREASAANKRAIFTCTVAAIEPSPAGELACALALAYAAGVAAYASGVCMNADDICRRVQ